MLLCSLVSNRLGVVLTPSLSSTSGAAQCSAETETLQAFAKINLSLRVVGRRPSDGYHLLAMVNGELSLADELRVTRNPEGDATLTITVSGESPPGTPIAEIENPGTSSLGRAFHAFCGAFALRSSLTVVVKKRIPTGAGLGGGTSDAAALLRWCWERLLTDEQRGQPASRELLDRIAVEIGADVPYSLRGGCALVTGVGEQIAPLSWRLSGVPVILVVPPVSVATPAAFAAYRAEASTFSDEQAATLLALSELPPPPAELVRNDLERVVSRHWPRVADTLLALRSGSSGAGADFVVGMTGSGSTLFCIPSQWSTSELVATRLEQAVISAAPRDCTVIPCTMR